MVAAAKAKQAEAEVDDAPEDETEQAAAKPKRKLLSFKMPSLKIMIVAAAGLLWWSAVQRLREDGRPPWGVVAAYALAAIVASYAWSGLGYLLLTGGSSGGAVGR